MSKEKFDLSNVGGQPKDWMQREHEKSLEPGLGMKFWIGLAALVTLLVAIALIFLLSPSSPYSVVARWIAGMAGFYFIAKELVDARRHQQDKTQRAINNTWEKLGRVENELSEFTREVHVQNLQLSARMNGEISEMKRRLSLLEQASNGH